jgi:hypothetical protein
MSAPAIAIQAGQCRFHEDGTVPGVATIVVEGGSGSSPNSRRLLPLPPSFFANWRRKLQLMVAGAMVPLTTAAAQNHFVRRRMGKDGQPLLVKS